MTSITTYPRNRTEVAQKAAIFGRMLSMLEDQRNTEGINTLGKHYGKFIRFLSPEWRKIAHVYFEKGRMKE